MKLSIVVPVYNVEKYINECLERLLKQCTDNCEVLLINDGSTDNSLSICESFCKKSNSFRVINQSNKGLSGARNTGIRESKGDYILFLDSDDYLSDDAVEILFDYMKNNVPDFFFIKSKSFEDGVYDYEENQSDYSLINTNDPAEAFKYLDSIKSFWFAAWLVVIKRDFLLQHNLFFKEKIYHEDELWVPKVFTLARSILLINECLYCYRKDRKGSIINKKSIKKEFDKIVVIDELKEVSKMMERDRKNILDGRCAALEYGLIRNLQQFSNDDEKDCLISLIQERLNYLKYKKYITIYVICKMIGVVKTSELLGKRGC